MVRKIAMKTSFTLFTRSISICEQFPKTEPPVTIDGSFELIALVIIMLYLQKMNGHSAICSKFFALYIFFAL